MPWPPLRLAAFLAGPVAGVIMLARRGRWVFTRWGWFWLFGDTPGVVAHLLLEPEPLWSRPGRHPARPSRPVRAYVGFVLGWGWGVVSILVLLKMLDPV